MDQVTRMLGQHWAMFYRANMSIDQLTPGQTLDQTVQQVNAYMQEHGRDLAAWEPGLQDEIARLLNVNWIYQRLECEPIRKPILIHEELGRYRVDCGDTRLMALSLCKQPPLVSVVITTVKERGKDFVAWTEIKTDQELIECLGMHAESTQIRFTPNDIDKDYAVSWLEIGDASTATHLHDIDKKLSMMQRYLDQQDHSFKFSTAWAQQEIAWTE